MGVTLPANGDTRIPRLNIALQKLRSLRPPFADSDESFSRVSSPDSSVPTDRIRPMPRLVRGLASSPARLHVSRRSRSRTQPAESGSLPCFFLLKVTFAPPIECAPYQNTGVRREIYLELSMENWLHLSVEHLVYPTAKSC